MILCAIGAFYSNNSNAESWYYEKALTLIPDFMESPSVDSFIGIILLVSYEVCIGHMHRAGIHLGMALRSVSLLRLDIDPDNLPEINGRSWIEKNSRRLIYWRLYILDLCESYIFNSSFTNCSTYLPNRTLMNVKMPISEEIWNCTEPNQITQILHDNPRPGSHSYASYYIPLVELYVDIHKAMLNFQSSYSEFVSNNFFMLKSRVDSYKSSIPFEALSFPSKESLYLYLNRSFGSDWTQLILFLTYHATICRLNRIPLLHFLYLSTCKSDGPHTVGTYALTLNQKPLFIECFKDVFKSAEMIAVMCDSLMRLPNPYAGFIPLYALHYIIIEATVILAIVSQSAEIIRVIVEADDDIVVLCKSFMAMNLKCLSTQKTKYSAARVVHDFAQNILDDMTTKKPNAYEYCNNVHILANETLEKLYRTDGFAYVRDDSVLETKPDSIQVLSDYFLKKATLI